MDENKAEIVKALMGVLQMTRAGSDIAEMSYKRHPQSKEEYVDIWYKDGANRRICVTADSGISLVRDVTGRIS